MQPSDTLFWLRAAAAARFPTKDALNNTDGSIHHLNSCYAAFSMNKTFYTRGVNLRSDVDETGYHLFVLNKCEEQ